jgi:peptidoglycan hydrolase-like protein with peptidoglycan-binding domain
MKFMTILAASVFAAALAFSGADAAGRSSQGVSGSGGIGSSQGVGSRSDQGLSSGGAVEGQSGISPSAQAQDAGRIRQVQQKLSTMGYSPGNLDGELDAQTMEAIRNFQQAQGIQPSGQLDVQTLSALGVSGQEGEGQQYYGVSPEFDQSEGIIQPSPNIEQQPGQQMDQQQLDRGMQQPQVDQYSPQQPLPQGTMGR